MANHLMIDFETLGQQPDTAVISLGAVLFSKDGIINEKMWIFNLMGQIEIGRRSISSDTLLWWMKQGAQAQAVFARCSEEGILIKDFIPSFTGFAQGGGGDVRIWGNGATFDISIIENIYARSQVKVPWKFYNQRCYRTMKACFGIDRPFEGVKHDALDDARHQAKCLMEYWKTNPGADK